MITCLFALLGFNKVSVEEHLNLTLSYKWSKIYTKLLTKLSCFKEVAVLEIEVDSQCLVMPCCQDNLIHRWLILVMKMKVLLITNLQ